MSRMSKLRDELSDEVGVILSTDFSIETTSTKNVPHSSDSSITFPNLDSRMQACKIIDTCVLYIDIRRSTELSISHKPKTVAKLYSAFVRAMTRCARHYGGHVRGIIGDRVMVIFDCENCFASAVNCAILMNSTAKYVINKHFRRNEVQCGIGIDAGKMVATKTGFRRRGHEMHNYKNLVWLGRPANVASKLTDIANKKGEKIAVDKVNVAYENIFLPSWTWFVEWPSDFVKNIEANVLGGITHKSSLYRNHFMITEILTVREDTKPILMTAPVYNGFKAARPDDESIQKRWFTKVNVEVPGYAGDVYGGDVHFTAFRE